MLATLAVAAAAVPNQKTDRDSLSKERRSRLLEKLMAIIVTKSESANPSLADVPKFRRRALLEGEAVFEQALAEATGMTKVQRRTEIDAVVDAFRDRHYRYVRVDGKAAA